MGDASYPSTSTTSLSLTKAAKYTLYVLYLTEVPIIGLPTTNGFYKISMALYTGVSSIILLLYTILIYFKSLQGSEVWISASGNTNRGILHNALNFLPDLLENVASLGINAISRALSACHIGIPVKLNAPVVAYSLVGIRKLISLASYAFITPLDDNSTHVKAFFGYLVINLIQYRYIMNTDNTIKGRSPSKVSFREGVTSFFVRPGKSMRYEAEKMIFRRRFLFFFAFVISALLGSTMLQTYAGIQGSYSLVRTLLPKILMLIDLEFLRTQLFEFDGIDLTIINTPESYFHKV
ncbi:DEKNAAC101363 [Brettanomyces naardenensis]|uniref:DEKNAAC101363 n=1 Tax=Brettanomyces naardenensis TaxID=13370 RepID=A0A448YHT7_BRENA|nr:DEKNAAC101363 [Brettanomyces naardenensis]